VALSLLLVLNTKAFLDGAHVRLKSAPIALYLGVFFSGDLGKGRAEVAPL